MRLINKQIYKMAFKDKNTLGFLKEYYEKKYSIKITYPEQFLTLEQYEKIKEQDPEFFNFGCSEIGIINKVTEKGTYKTLISRSCVGSNCNMCAYGDILKKDSFRFIYGELKGKSMYELNMENYENNR